MEVHRLRAAQAELPHVGVVIARYADNLCPRRMTTRLPLEALYGSSINKEPTKEATVAVFDQVLREAFDRCVNGETPCDGGGSYESIQPVAPAGPFHAPLPSAARRHPA